MQNVFVYLVKMFYFFKSYKKNTKYKFYINEHFFKTRFHTLAFCIYTRTCILSTCQEVCVWSFQHNTNTRQKIITIGEYLISIWILLIELQFTISIFRNWNSNSNSFDFCLIISLSSVEMNTIKYLNSSIWIVTCIDSGNTWFRSSLILLLAMLYVFSWITHAAINWQIVIMDHKVYFLISQICISVCKP